jgi:hypothetical protein
MINFIPIHLFKSSKITNYYTYGGKRNYLLLPKPYTHKLLPILVDFDSPSFKLPLVWKAGNICKINFIFHIRF